jgi:hypothetical protein
MHSFIKAEEEASQEKPPLMIELLLVNPYKWNVEFWVEVIRYMIMVTQVKTYMYIKSVLSISDPVDILTYTYSPSCNFETSFLEDQLCMQF